jgi:hypothetical protein
MNYEEIELSAEIREEVFFLSLHADRRSMWGLVQNACSHAKSVSVVSLNPNPSIYALRIIEGCGARYHCPNWRGPSWYRNDTGFIPTAGTLAMFVFVSMLALSEDFRIDISDWMSRAYTDLYSSEPLRRDLASDDTNLFFLGPKESFFALVDIERRFLELGKSSVVCATYSDFLHGLHNCIDPRRKNAFYFLDEPELHAVGKEISQYLLASGQSLHKFCSHKSQSAGRFSKWMVESVVLALMLAELKSKGAYRAIDPEWVRISSLILD